MKPTLFKSLIVSVALASSSAHAAVTLQFSVPFSPGSGVANAFALASGTPSNDLFYGIIVDGTRNGFLATYDPVMFAVGSANGNAGNLLGNGGVLTDDRLYFAQDRTADNSALTEGDFSTTGGTGGISGLTLDFAGDVNAGDPFAIVWFDSNGVDAGLLTDPSFLIPSDGAIADNSSPFVGEDSARPANDITLVPEPSTLLLSAFGVLGLLRRKR